MKPQKIEPQNTLPDRVATHASAAIKLLGLEAPETCDSIKRLAWHVLWHDPHATVRDVCDAIIERREARDRKARK